MSGEGHTISFRRTSMTQKSNQELLEEFKDLAYSSKRIMSHMKWYGREHSVELVEHGDEEQPKWRQESVAITDTFEFYISTYESWHDDANNYECHNREFAKDNWLMYFSEGFPAEWIEQEIIDGEKNWNHFVVQPDDKNIDKICKVWHEYSMNMIRSVRFGQSDKMKRSYWEQARDNIKSIMEHHDNYEYAI